MKKLTPRQFLRLVAIVGIIQATAMLFGACCDPEKVGSKCYVPPVDKCASFKAAHKEAVKDSTNAAIALIQAEDSLMRHGAYKNMFEAACANNDLDPRILSQRSQAHRIAVKVYLEAYPGTPREWLLDILDDACVHYLDVCGKPAEKFTPAKNCDPNYTGQNKTEKTKQSEVSTAFRAQKNYRE